MKFLKKIFLLKYTMLENDSIRSIGNCEFYNI